MATVHRATRRLIALLPGRELGSSHRRKIGSERTAAVDCGAPDGMAHFALYAMRRGARRDIGCAPNSAYGHSRTGSSAGYRIGPLPDTVSGRYPILPPATRRYSYGNNSPATRAREGIGDEFRLQSERVEDAHRDVMLPCGDEQTHPDDVTADIAHGPEHCGN